MCVNVSITAALPTHLLVPDAAVVLISSQITNIIKFFLSRNIRIARERAWDHTVASRGKGPDFWQPYVEEWQRAPIITTSSWDKWLGGWFGRVVVRRVVSIPLSLYPIVGLAFTAYIKAIGTAQYLHKPVRNIPSNLTCDAALNNGIT